MPGKVKVKIISGKNLPVMDRSSDTTDAYVEIKLANITYKTEVCRRTLHPEWNSDWYRFEVDDTELQDEPLQIRLMDHDTYSANDAIGKVYLNLNPLLLPVAGQLAGGDSSPHHEISGWIPVYDTMHGIRGEVNVTVKVELFSDFNRFRQSSCGVQFFYCKSNVYTPKLIVNESASTIPHGFQVKIINGFVEELIVNDDPEYQWIDKIRTPRASNEARQTLFFKLSGELQRKIGVKALALGGNAVIGFKQCFDLEGESGIVARGIGTAVTLVKTHTIHHTSSEPKDENIDNYLKFVGDGKTFSLPILHSLNPTHFLPFNLDTQPVQGLLNQEDKRGQSAMSRRLRKFKNPQKSLSKKMIAFKNKINESIGEDEERTCTDKRNLFKRTSSDSSAMAEILARSVMKATTSLTCILEDQPPNEEDTLNKLKPVEDLLRAESFDSSTSDSLSSSDDEYTKSKNDVETISNIVSNVERLQRCLSGEGLRKQFSMPSIPTRGYSLGSLDSIPQQDSLQFDENFMDRRSSDLSHIRSESLILYRPLQKAKKLERFDEVDLSSSMDMSFSKPNVVTASQKQIDDEENETSLIKAKKWSFSSLGSIKSKPPSASMINTALNAMLFERASLVGTPTNESKKEFNFETKSEQEIDKTPSLPLNLHEQTSESSTSHVPKKTMVKSALETMLMERAEILGSLDSPPLEVTASAAKKESRMRNFDTILKNVRSSKDRLNSQSSEAKSTMFKSALETMLMERADILGTPETLSFDSESSPKLLNEAKHKFFGATPFKHAEIPESSMLKTALGAMLLERAEILGTQDAGTSPDFAPKMLPDKESKTMKTSEVAHNDEVQTLASAENIHIQPKKMVKTAMQAMLLEKFNLLGTYTPPASPSASSADDCRKRAFSFDKNMATRKTFPKSSSFASLGVHERETVLGVPFTSLSSLKSDEKIEQEHELKKTKKHFFNFHFHSKHHRSNVDKRFFTRLFHHSYNNHNKDEGTQTSFNSLQLTPNSLEPPISQSDLASGDFHSKTSNKAFLTNTQQSILPTQQQQQQQQDGDNGTELISQSPPPSKMNYMIPLHRRSSDSDLSITPKGNSLTGSDKSASNTAAYYMRNNYARRGHINNQDHFDMLEYPFLTMSKLSSKFVSHIGGSVSARSVKLLERILNVEEPESRDTWWSEIRMEIRSHARSLNCNAVLGYTELTSICDDVCVLSASGTAAIIDFSTSILDDEIPHIFKDNKPLNGHKESPLHQPLLGCRITHLPYYEEKSVPLKAKIKCSMCGRGKVPDVLIVTIEPPDSIPTSGKGCLIESHVTRPLKDVKGEAMAKDISDGLPFLEYELHRLLLNKLKIKGMNAIFSLKVRLSVGEKMLVGVATGTAIFVSSLPSPDLPVLVTSKPSDEKHVAEMQAALNKAVKLNKEIYQIKDENNQQIEDDSEEEQGTLDISCGNKDCCILEMDDPDDTEVYRLIMQEKVPDGFHVVSTESVLGLDDLEIVRNLQMFTQIYRARVAPTYNLQHHLKRVLQSIYFKLRRMVPCALCDLQFRVDLPEPDELQLCVIGMALSLGKKGRKALPANTDEELMFNLEEDDLSKTGSIKYRNRRSPTKQRNLTYKRLLPSNERHGVDITPLSYVPGGNIEQYLGNLNFFFIRETTSIREEGGLSGFIHSFVTEVLAIVRSHVTALGGNALVAFFMTECALNYNLHKNQGQCLINVGGDVVSVMYSNDD